MTGTGDQTKSRLVLDQYLQSLSNPIKLHPLYTDMNCFSIDDNEQYLQSSPICQILPQCEIPGIKLHPEQCQEIQKPGPVAQTMVVLGQAFTQRKGDNYRQLNLYMNNHMQYYIPHMNVLVQLETRLLTRIYQTKLMFRSVYQFVEQIKQAYVFWQSQHKKIKLVCLSEGTGSGYKKLEGGLLALKSFTDSQSSLVQSASLWLQDDCLAQIRDSIEIYWDSLKFFVDQINLLKSQTNKNLRAIYQQYYLIQKMMVRGTRKGADLLYEELVFVDLIGKAKVSVVGWGKMVDFLWKALQKNQTFLLKTLKTSLVGCITEIGKLGMNAQKHNQVMLGWKQLDPQCETLKLYSVNKMLPEDCRRFICNHIDIEQLQNQHFQQFVAMGHQSKSVGELGRLSETLSVKKFQCMVDIGAEGNLSEALIHSTIDGCLVIVLRDNTIPYTKMLIGGISVEIMDGTRLAVTEKRPGVLKSSVNREILKFKNTDEMEEFLVFTSRSSDSLGLLA